ncbi:MAG: DNA internalization-related competence protein ComEC/Rec2 [Butyrivibrio sp.]|nr:DNA internalization-related competence protein ComEC/Rec2 [Butyrivibrio sp.]
MKRPLLGISLVFAVVVSLFMFIFPFSSEISVEDGSEIQFTGKIYQKEYKISSSGETARVIYLQSLSDKDERVQCYLDEPLDILQKDIAAIGSTVCVKGKIRCFHPATNPGEFDSPQYYQILKIKYRIQKGKIIASDRKIDFYKEALFKIRCSLERVLDNSLEAKDSSIMKAVLLGDKAFMDEEIKELYKRSGIIHILAVSGLHISIIGMGLYKTLRKVGCNKYVAALVAMTFMWSYGIMCSMSASAFRAIVMFILRLCAGLLGRTYDMLTAMAVSGLLLIIEQPLYLNHSGFLMSYGAILAIGFVIPVLKEDVGKAFGLIYLNADNRIGLKAMDIAGYFITAMTGSVSILLVTLPVYMDYYYTVPLYGFILNLLVLPLMPFLMVSGIGCMVVGYFLPLGGVVFGQAIHAVLSIYEYACRIADYLPGGVIYTGYAGRVKAFIYLTALGIYVLLKLHKKLSDRLPQGITFGIRYGILFIGMVILCSRERYDIRLTFLDVGQGDAIVMECRGDAYLIDGGSTSKKNVGKYQLKPFLSYEGIGRLKAVILTHEDEDHFSGMLELIEDTQKGGIAIDNLILPEVSEDSKGDNYKRLCRAAEDNNIKISYIKRGDILSQQGVLLKCLGPVQDMETDSPNEYSTVLYIQKDSFKALLTGDIEGRGQENLKEYLKNEAPEVSELTLLKAAHHGSRYTTDEEFLQRVRPLVTVISCGENNKYGHPHKELMERLERNRSRIYVTKDFGAITVTYNKKKAFIDTFIKSPLHGAFNGENKATF